MGGLTRACSGVDRCRSDSSESLGPAGSQRPAISQTCSIDNIQVSLQREQLLVMTLLVERSLELGEYIYKYLQSSGPVPRPCARRSVVCFTVMMLTMAVW